MSIDNRYKQDVLLTPEWERMILLAKRVKFGEFRVKIRDGKPYIIENIVQQIRLDNDSDFKLHSL